MVNLFECSTQSLHYVHQLNVVSPNFTFHIILCVSFNVLYIYQIFHCMFYVLSYSILFSRTAVDPCLSNPCLNTGTCFTALEGDSYFCSCTSGFVGANCEESISKVLLKCHSTNCLICCVEYMFCTTRCVVCFAFVRSSFFINKQCWSMQT